MPLVEVLLALKCHGTRFAPGAVLHLSDEEVSSLPEGTVRTFGALGTALMEVPVVAPPPPVEDTPVEETPAVVPPVLTPDEPELEPAAVAADAPKADKGAAVAAARARVGRATGKSADPPKGKG